MRAVFAIAAVMFTLAACGGGSGGGKAVAPELSMPEPSIVDTDGDGVGDNSDAFPNDPAETADTDGDGIGDNSDAFPNDPAETADTDGDGIGDNSDAFPNDPAETADTDGDGIGDNSDAFPNDPAETADTDGDGVGDNSDASPNDPAETADTDDDGVGDNSDAFPNDPAETADTDGDGVGDNSDAFPNDPAETADTDGDGVGDNSDAFPNDSSKTLHLNPLPFPLQASNPGAASWSSSGMTCLAGSGCRSHNFQWSAHIPHYGTDDLPVPETADAQHLPTYHDHRSASRQRLFVGVDQGNIGSLPRTGDYDGVEIRYGTLADGAGKPAVSAYLSEAAQVPIRWDSAPVVT